MYKVEELIESEILGTFSFRQHMSDFMCNDDVARLVKRVTDNDIVKGTPTFTFRNSMQFNNVFFIDVYSDRECVDVIKLIKSIGEFKEDVLTYPSF